SAARLRLAELIAALARPANRLGSPLSCVQAELWDPRGAYVRAACVSAGQRLAVLPCALAVEDLVAGVQVRRGIVRPADWLVPGGNPGGAWHCSTSPHPDCFARARNDTRGCVRVPGLMQHPA